MIKVLLKGPEGKQRTVDIDQDATVRDVAIEACNLFYRYVLLNGEKVPLTTHVHDGDRVEVVTDVFKR